MKYVANLFSPIPKAAKSHVLGWSLYWANALDAEILRNLLLLTSKDCLYVEHGVNFGGSLNLFGGVSDEIASNIEHLVKTKPRIVSLDIEMPKYADFLESRLKAKSTSSKLTLGLISEFRKLLESADTMHYPYQKPSWVSIGDSHTTAYAKPGSEVHRTNGLTLHGLLNKWNERFINTDEPRYSDLKGITVSAGSIDIRHHLMRQENPNSKAMQMVDSLVMRARALENKGINVELTVPVPIEYEDRKIPKTGFYKGSPFYGSFDERKALTEFYSRILKERWHRVVSPPTAWYEMNPKDYADMVMERAGSVHISPTHYRTQIIDHWEKTLND